MLNCGVKVNLSKRYLRLSLCENWVNFGKLRPDANRAKQRHDISLSTKLNTANKGSEKDITGHHIYNSYSTPCV